MATNIPPHNLGEVIDAVTAYIDDPSLDVAGLMKHVKGPDFPTAGIILGRGGIREAYETGRGRVLVRGRAHIEPLKQGKQAIIVTEMPYQVYKGDGRGDGSGLIMKLKEAHDAGRLPEITDLRDESDRNGIRLVIELKRDAIPKVVLNKIYKHTPLQTTFGVNMVALVDGVPKTLNLRELIHHYVDHQREVIIRRTQYELRQAEARAHILEGLLVALDNLDEVIALIRASRDPEAARLGLQDEDYVEHLFVCSTHDFLLFFTNRGKVYRQKVYELPEASRTAKGRALVNILPLREGEFVRAVLATRDFTEGKYLVFATKKGQIKKTEFLAYNTPIKADGIIAIKIRDDDELVAVREIDDGDDVIMISRSGQASRFKESSARPMGRDTGGVRGMNVSQGKNWVLAMDVVQPDAELLVVTENGYGKRTDLDEYP